MENGSKIENVSRIGDVPKPAGKPADIRYLKMTNMIVFGFLISVSIVLVAFMLLGKNEILHGKSHSAMQIANDRIAKVASYGLGGNVSFLFLVTFFACYGTHSERPYVLYISMTLLIILSLLTYAGAISLLIVVMQMYTEEYFTEIIHSYSTRGVTEQLFTSDIEYDYRCCGCNSTKDYTDFNQTFSFGCENTFLKLNVTLEMIPGCCQFLGQASKMPGGWFVGMTSMFATLGLVSGIICGILASKISKYNKDKFKISDDGRPVGEMTINQSARSN